MLGTWGREARTAEVTEVADAANWVKGCAAPVDRHEVLIGSLARQP